MIIDYYETVQMWKSSKKQSKKLQAMPCRKHAEMEKNTSIDARATEKR